VVEDAAGHQRPFQRDRAFHVRAAVIDVGGHRQQAVMQRARLDVVLGLAGGDHLDQRLGCDAAIAHQRAVDVEHRVQQVLVVAGQDLQVGALLADDWDLAVPALHVAHAVLHREHAGLGGDVELRLQVVGALCRVGVLEQDQRQAAAFVDRAIAVLRCAVLIAEAQPAVRGVYEAGLGAGLDRALGFLNGNLRAFERDARDDGDAVADRLAEGLDHFELFVTLQERAFAGMAENRQALDTGHAGEPIAQALDRGVIDGAVAGERGDGGGVEAAQIDRGLAHVGSFQRVERWSVHAL
jgi:hypothetical protein